MTETPREVSPADALRNEQERVHRAQMPLLRPEIRVDVERAHDELDELLRRLKIKD